MKVLFILRCLLATLPVALHGCALLDAGLGTESPFAPDGLANSPVDGAPVDGAPVDGCIDTIRGDDDVDSGGFCDLPEENETGTAGICVGRRSGDLVCVQSCECPDDTQDICDDGDECIDAGDPATSPISTNTATPCLKPCDPNVCRGCQNGLCWAYSRTDNLNFTCAQ